MLQPDLLATFWWKSIAHTAKVSIYLLEFPHVIKLLLSLQFLKFNLLLNTIKYSTKLKYSLNYVESKRIYFDLSSCKESFGIRNVKVKDFFEFNIHNYRWQNFPCMKKDRNIDVLTHCI